MSRAYKDNFRLIDWSVPLPEVPRPSVPPSKRSALPGPAFISDSMAPTQCMADGKLYTSKRAMSATHRAMGFTEIGNEQPKPRERRGLTTKAEIKVSLEKAEARHTRGERARSAPQ